MSCVSSQQTHWLQFECKRCCTLSCWRTLVWSYPILTPSQFSLSTLYASYSSSPLTAFMSPLGSSSLSFSTLCSIPLVHFQRVYDHCWNDETMLMKDQWSNLVCFFLLETFFSSSFLSRSLAGASIPRSYAVNDLSPEQPLRKRKRERERERRKCHRKLSGKNVFAVEDETSGSTSNELFSFSLLPSFISFFFLELWCLENEERQWILLFFLFSCEQTASRRSTQIIQPLHVIFFSFFCKVQKESFMSRMILRYTKKLLLHNSKIKLCLLRDMTLWKVALKGLHTLVLENFYTGDKVFKKLHIQEI